MFGTTFNTAARAGAANLLLPVKSQLLAESSFPFVIYYFGHLSNCAGLVQSLPKECQGTLHIKETNLLVPLLCSLFVLSCTGTMYL